MSQQNCKIAAKNELRAKISLPLDCEEANSVAPGIIVGKENQCMNYTLSSIA